MNERIKELAKEAGLEGDNGHYEYDWFNPEKFAQLIVKECVSMVKGFEYAIGRDGLSDAMSEHFGVKE